MLRTQEKLKSQRHNVLAEEINKIGLTLKRIGGGGGGGGVAFSLKPLWFFKRCVC